MRRTVSQIATLAMILAAPSAFGQTTAHSHPQEKPSTASPSQQNMDDATYVQMMRMHHEQGVKMAQLAVEKAQRPEVKQFAEKMVTDQKHDIAKLEKLGPGTRRGRVSRWICCWWYASIDSGAPRHLRAPAGG